MFLRHRPQQCSECAFGLYATSGCIIVCGLLVVYGTAWHVHTQFQPGFGAAKVFLTLRLAWPGLHGMVLVCLLLFLANLAEL